MNKTLTLTAALMMIGAGASAQSVNASNPGTVAAALQSLGHTTEVTVDSYGDPMIYGSIDTNNYQILFYGCTDNVNCMDLQFRADFDTDYTPSGRKLADYNRDRMVGKAYINTADGTTLEHSVIGVDGMSRVNFKRTTEKFLDAMDYFRGYLSD